MAGLQLQLDTEREEKRLLQEQLQEAEVGSVRNDNPSLPESIMQTFSVVLTFESVDEILKCDHSNESY